MLYKKRKTGSININQMNRPIIHSPLPKAVIFAAGLGTRLKPFTNNHPKALAKVNGKTLLERNIEYLKSYDITEIIINVHHFADQIIDFLELNNYFDVNLQISNESDEILETGGALVKAKELIGEESFLAMNVDILTDLSLEDLIQFHYQNQPLATLAVSDRESSRKLFFDKNKELKAWKNFNTNEEIKASEEELKELAFSGIQIINPKIFNKMPKTGKFSIITTYLDLMKDEKILGFEHSSENWIDVGRAESVIEAEKIFK